MCENCSLKQVTIKNGGGVKVTFSREDFDQRNYEKPSVDHVEKMINEISVTKKEAKKMIEAEVAQLPKKNWKQIILLVKDISLIAGLIKLLLFK